MNWFSRLSFLFSKEREVTSAASWVQLATLSCDGLPSVRTVVFRGLVDRVQNNNKKQPYHMVPIGASTEDFALNETPYFIICSDIRSTKFKGLQSNTMPFELCWMLRDQNVQFRLSGTAFVIPHECHLKQFSNVEYPQIGGKTSNIGNFWEDIRMNVLNSLNEFLLKCFCSKTPGNIVTEQVNIEQIPVNNDTASKNCCLLVLDAKRVEYLHLTTAERIEWILCDEKWLKHEIYP